MPQVPDMHGFPDEYFRIRAAGTQDYWTVHAVETSLDGNALHLWPSKKDVNAVRQQYYHLSHHSLT